MNTCSACGGSFEHTVSSALRGETRCRDCRGGSGVGRFALRRDAKGKPASVVALCGGCGARHVPTIAAMRRRDYRCPACLALYAKAKRLRAKAGIPVDAPMSRSDLSRWLADPDFMASHEAERKGLKPARKPAENSV